MSKIEEIVEETANDLLNSIPRTEFLLISDRKILHFRKVPPFFQYESTLSWRLPEREFRYILGFFREGKIKDRLLRDFVQRVGSEKKKKVMTPLAEVGIVYRDLFDRVSPLIMQLPIPKDLASYVDLFFKTPSLRFKSFDDILLGVFALRTITFWSEDMFRTLREEKDLRKVFPDHILDKIFAVRDKLLEIDSRIELSDEKIKNWFVRNSFFEINVLGPSARDGKCYISTIDYCYRVAKKIVHRDLCLSIELREPRLYAFDDFLQDASQLLSKYRPYIRITEEKSKGGTWPYPVKYIVRVESVKAFKFLCILAAISWFIGQLRYTFWLIDSSSAEEIFGESLNIVTRTIIRYAIQNEQPQTLFFFGTRIVDLMEGKKWKQEKKISILKTLFITGEKIISQGAPESRLVNLWYSILGLI